MPSLPKFNLLVLSVKPERLGLPPFSLPQSLGKVINGLIFELGLRRRPPLLALLPMIGMRLLVGEETLIPLLKILDLGSIWSSDHTLLFVMTSSRL